MRSLMTNSNSLFMQISEGELGGGMFADCKLEAWDDFW